MLYMIDMKIPSVALSSSSDRALTRPATHSLARLCYSPNALEKQTMLDNSQMKGRFAFINAHNLGVKSAASATFTPDATLFSATTPRPKYIQNVIPGAITKSVM